MNILYLSYINPYPWSGPTYSVPKQIDAQSKLDNVFWYNLIDPNSDIGKKWMPGVNWRDLPYYADLSKYPQKCIKNLPSPFCNPDIIVIEQFYGMIRSGVIKQVIKGKVPYIIVPRGELAKDAQKRKGLKKRIANLILFNKFAKKASAIHFLTEQEREDSGNKWNSNSFIIPNGIGNSSTKKTQFCTNGELRCISIGRIEPYQKGFDLLIEACASIQDELRQSNCKISIHGPDRVGRLNELKETVSGRAIEDIIQFGDALYENAKENSLLDSDVFVMTSRFEGHPMSLIEAMNYGLPCLITTGTNMRSEVEKFDAGWTSDNTVEGIKEALLTMVNEKRRMSEKGSNAEKLSQNYNWTKIAEVSHKRYAELVR